MHSFRHRTELRALRGLIAAFVALVLFTGVASAQESFHATHYTQLAGENEVPQVDTAGIGIGIFALNPLTGALDYRITVTGMSSPITAAHFHRASIDSAGPVVQPINWPSGKMTATGTWNMTLADMQDLLAGRIYVNVHTQMHPNGEVRGQLFLFNNAAAFLSGAQAVPPVADTVPTGSALLWVDTTNHQALYSITWEGLSGAATTASLSVGAPGVSGQMIHQITFNAGDSVATGAWTNLSASDMAQLLAGGVYVNVNTAAHPNGEIRGQVYHADAYTTAISSTNAVPPSGTNAMGTGYMQLSSNGSESVGIGYFIVEDASGPVTQGTLNAGASGQVGIPVAPLGAVAPGFPFFLGFPSASNDVWAGLLQQGLYVNFITSQFGGGEARGQLVSAATNLSVAAVASVAGQSLDPVSGRSLSARVDRDGGIAFEATGGVREGSVLLYSALGARVADVTLNEGSARLDATSLPAGLYLAQLVIDGRAVAVCRVPLAR